ncbi:class II fructose-bisphosphatase [uncultured Megasphaera sp.]|jgi:fructose-1,6-bisphosphatase II|uniref:class II fructose-bisphosphatase n=1 Tax=uncultured Megasphaera sp. TaxID=165188 RepID=UPI0025FA5C3F|nr:class II fructose-bisphosphatase [uncultured Megasphaera sp.]
MDRVLTLELVRATEAAAMRAGRMMGIGDAEAAHHLAATGMHQELAAAPVSGRVVIGEGHMADGQVLFDGEEIGRGRVPVDIAVAALDGQKLVAQGQPGAVSVLAMAGRGDILRVPDMYMEKICVGPRAKGRIDLNQSVQDNLRHIAEGLERSIDDVTVAILDRQRHQDLIRECRTAGARIRLIHDGDVTAAADAAIEGSGTHVLLGIGGAREGVLAAAALRCLGGDMQARLIPYTERERQKGEELGIHDFKRILTLSDLVRGDDCFFAATAVTPTPLMQGVRYFGGGARTMSVVMRYKTGTIRFIDTVHRLNASSSWSVRK